MSQVISTKKSYIDPRDLPAVDRATLRRALSYLRPHAARGAAVLGVLVAVAAMGLLPPLLIKDVVDLAIPERRGGLLVLLCAGMVVAPLLAGLLQVLQKVLTTRTSEQVMLDLRVELFSHLQAQPLSYFTLARPGEALSRVLNDVQGAGSAVATTLVSVASNLVTFVLALVAVVWLDWRLALLALVLLPVYVIPTRRVGRRRKVLKRESQALMAQLTGLLAETLSISGAQLIKVFGTEEVETDRLRTQGQRLMDVNVRQALAGRWFTMVLGEVSEDRLTAGRIAGHAFVASYAIALAAALIATAVAFATGALRRDRVLAVVFLAVAVLQLSWVAPAIVHHGVGWPWNFASLHAVGGALHLAMAVLALGLAWLLLEDPRSV